MHISEGVLSGPVLAAGAAVALAGTAVGLRKLDLEEVAQAGMLAAAFFVASLIRIPVGFASVHLIMSGIVGILLGWSAFPAILTALILQAMLFQFGGITTLGVNTVIMAFPAVACHLIFRPFVRKSNGAVFSVAFACGSGAVLMAGLMMGGVLVLTGEAFLEVAAITVAVHLPVMVIEGIVTAGCVVFLKKVKPEMLPGPVGDDAP